MLSEGNPPHADRYDAHKDRDAIFVHSFEEAERRSREQMWAMTPEERMEIGR